MDNASAYVPLVEVTRGDIIESVHFGAIAITDHHGNLYAYAGDSQLVTYLRSSSKPFQLIPLIEQGGTEKFNLTDQEISVMCASHIGTDMHIEVIREIQGKVGINEAELLCGIHAPVDKPSAQALRLRNEQPTQNHHNCSGKHTGFLAQAVLNIFNKEDYINPTHPVQQNVIRTFSEMCHVEQKDIHVGIDGCSAPVFGIAILNASWGFAELSDPTQLSTERAAACRKITHAMTSFPEMVSGYGKFDTRLMQIGNGKIVSKGGAEGFQAIGLLPGAIGPDSPALGIAIKISDGDLTHRAADVAAMEVLRQLGALNDSQFLELNEFHSQSVTNWRKIEVGQLRPRFQLIFN